MYINDTQNDKKDDKKKPFKRFNSFPHHWYGSELVELGSFFISGKQTLQEG